MFAGYPQRENFILAAAWWRQAGFDEAALYAAARSFRLGRHRLARVGIELGRIRVADADDMARIFDDGDLEAEADAEERNPLLAAVLHAGDLARDAALAEPAGHDHAIEAFDVNAVDYLLKPVESARLETAIERVRRRMQSERATRPPAGGDLDRLLQMLGERTGRREQLALKVGDRFLLIHADEVVHASVDDDVITVATNSLSGTSNYRTLDELQARLDPGVFWRVHRSHLVNITKIKEIVPWFSRNYLLKMKDPKATEIPVSRSQTRRLREYLQL